MNFCQTAQFLFYFLDEGAVAGVDQLRVALWRQNFVDVTDQPHQFFE